MAAETFTQRGVPALDAWSGPAPATSPASGRGGESAMFVLSFG